MLPYRTKLNKYLLVLFFILILVYTAYEVQGIHKGPEIYLAHPNGDLKVNTEQIDISGTVKNVKNITINGRPISISEDGSFTERLLLSKGYNRFVFEAEDKFYRKKTEILEVIYDPPPSATDKSQNTEKKTLQTN